MNHPKPDLVRAHLFIKGRVQGVGFRYFTKTNARELGVNGWVKNLEDGRVETVFEGSEDQIEAMHKRCQNGPGRVDSIDFEWEKIDQRFDSFTVKRF